MNDLQIFVYSGEQLRTVQRDDGLWWVLRDVCRVLNIGNVTDTKKRLDPDEVDLTDLTDGMGRVQSTTIINEPGLVRRDPTVGQAGGQTVQALGHP